MQERSSLLIAYKLDEEAWIEAICNSIFMYSCIRNVKFRLILMFVEEHWTKWCTWHL